MKVKDITVHMHFDDGSYHSIVSRGYVYDVVNTGEGTVRWLTKTGREHFIENSQRNIFIDLGEWLKRYKDMRLVTFSDEIERDSLR